MSSFVDELVDFLNSENVEVTFDSNNFYKEIFTDRHYRSLIVLLSIYCCGKGDSKKIDANVLRLVQFVTLNPSLKERLVRLILKSKQKNHVVGDDFFLPEGFRTDTIYEDIIKYLYISRLITWDNESLLSLTPKGVLLSETILIYIKNSSSSFKKQLDVITMLASYKITKRVVGI